MFRGLARKAWFWAILGGALPSLAFVLYVMFPLGGDLTLAYRVTPDFYGESILPDVYPSGSLRFASTPYDSIYFLALANDPTLKRHVALPDRSGWVFYRGRRMFWPWIGWLLGWGRPDWILVSLPLAQILLLGAAQYAFARTLIANGRHPAWSLLHALGLGTAVCFIRPLADLFATDLVILGLFALSASRDGLAALAFACAALTKETTVLVPAVIVLRFAVLGGWRRAIRYALVPAVLLAWWGWIAALMPVRSVDAHNIGLPFIDLYRRLTEPIGPKGYTELFALGATIVNIATVFAAGRKDWDLLRFILVPPAILAISSSLYIWYDYYSYGRVHMLIPALLLWRYAIRGRRFDLAGPCAAALAGGLVWGAHLGYYQGLARILRSPFHL